MEEERLNKINQEKQNALNNSNNLYGGLLNDNENLYNQQNKYAEEYEKTQNDALDKQLSYNEKIIEQQKEEARKNKEIEERKALNDYTAFINPYGYQAENMANNGLLQSGVSETSKLGGFNTYQNRISAANSTMQKAFTDYDNDINQARLTNDVTKAQNALNKLQMQLEYAQNYYSNKSTISQNQLSNNQNLDSEYNSRYQNEYQKIQDERARAEAIRQWEAEMQEKQRQYNESLALQREQMAQEQAQWEKEYALSKYSATSRTSSSSNGSLSNTTTLSDTNSSLDNLGNNADTQNKSDYYFKSTTGDDYQPRYINNVRLSKSGKTLGNIGSISGVSSKKNIWKAGSNYYVWDEDHYIDVTEMYNKK